MPSFNKGVFEGVQFDAVPVGNFRILSSTFRWYRPYAPGDYINFNLKLKALDKNGCGIGLSYIVYEKEIFVANLFCEGKFNTRKVEGIPTPGEGTVSYCLKSLFDNNKSVVIVSVVPTHNDWLVSFAMGSLFTLFCVILAWLLSLIHH